jgi:hypothetical protein
MQHQVVSRAEWLKARTALLEHEKALTRHRDQIRAERLALPWVRIEKDYVFDGPEGKLTLSDLFRGRSQLYIKHFMMAPGAQHQCVGCSLEVDHVTDILPHLENHDVSYAVVARAPIEEIVTLTTTSMSRSSRRTSPLDARSTISDLHLNGPPPYKICRAAASFIRMRQARSFIPIRPMVVAVRKCWESTASSTSCRKAATRPVPTTR